MTAYRTAFMVCRIPSCWRLAVVAALAGAVVLFASIPARARPVLLATYGRATPRGDTSLGPASPRDASVQDALTRPSRSSARVVSRPRWRVIATDRDLTVGRVLGDAATAGAITGVQRHEWLAQYRQARSVREALSGARRTELSAVLATLETIAARGQLTPSRMPALFLTLKRNTEYWRRPDLCSMHASPTVCSASPKLHVTFAGDPVLFQWYRGRGLQIQPLANFAHANALWAACTTPSVAPDAPPCRRDELRALLDRMVALASWRGGFLAWEYFFAYDNGQPPWVSGIAQGTAIQALARGSRLLGDPRYLNVTRSALGAFEQRPPLGVGLGIDGGTHYLEYSFAPSQLILNGFLQALIGLFDYARIAHDSRARTLFAAGDAAARIELPRFDTGAWSLYAQGGHESDLSYHVLVRDFLRRLCDRTGVSVYCATASRFDRYLREPAQVRMLAPRWVCVGQEARIGVTLSKIARMTIRIRHGSQMAWTRNALLSRGPHFWRWRPNAPGMHVIDVSAQDLAGHETRGEWPMRVGTGLAGDHERVARAARGERLAQAPAGHGGCR